MRNTREAVAIAATTIIDTNVVISIPKISLMAFVVVVVVVVLPLLLLVELVTYVGDVLDDPGNGTKPKRLLLYSCILYQPRMKTSPKIHSLKPLTDCRQSAQILLPTTTT